MLAIAVLAAGKGTRMKSTLPKVLQPLAGKPLIERVLKSCEKIDPDRKFLIVGHQAETIKQRLGESRRLEYVIQNPQKGTGHAIQQLIPILSNFEGNLLVLNGDVPLISQDTIKALVYEHQESRADVTLLTAKQKNPQGYGRVFTNKDGVVKSIIEDRDCNQEELNNNLTNAGIYCFNWKKLKAVLPMIKSTNDQAEIYLTDTIAMLELVKHIEVKNISEILGINNRLQLANCESIIQKQLHEYWMEQGVSFIDSSSCTLSEECSFGIDVIIEPQTHIRGNCTIGNNCKLGPGTILENVNLGNNVNIFKSVLKNSHVDSNVEIGPFANIRPGSEVEKNTKIGNFVEIKKSIIGEGSKVNHLSYIGDAKLGSNVNIGAGTITANYDGRNKHETNIGEGSKTGANSVLVAPITLGRGVTVGAGSTLTKNVPSNSLAIERSKQLIKANWKPQK